MDYLKIVSYKGYELNVKRRTKKQRSDKKHTVQALLSPSEKRILNLVMVEQGENQVVRFVTDTIYNYLHLAITAHDIAASNRLLHERDGIQVNARLDAEVYERFRLVQADRNLTQRALVYILIKKAISIAGYDF